MPKEVIEHEERYTARPSQKRFAQCRCIASSVGFAESITKGRIFWKLHHPYHAPKNECDDIPPSTSARHILLKRKITRSPVISLPIPIDLARGSSSFFTSRRRLELDTTPCECLSLFFSLSRSEIHRAGGKDRGFWDGLRASVGETI